MIRSIIALFGATCVCAAAGASVVPYTETFSADNANWGGGGNWQAFEPLDWSSSGGPGGSGYVSTTLPFQDHQPGMFPALTIFRGQDNYGSSGNAFVGDWTGSGITQFSFWVRHNSPEELLYSVRFVPVGSNSPSMNFEFSDTLVQPNTWTQLSLTISPDTPGWVVGGGPGTYDAVFSNLGKIQIGVNPDPLAGLEDDITFDLSNVSINVPAPGALCLLGLAGFGRRARRRKDAPML